MKQYDVIVAGGGMVGAATALGLAKLGLDVAVLEGFAPRPFANTQPMDLRVSAISPHSVALLDRLGAWNEVLNMRLCPFKRLETWENPECRTRFNADDMGLDQLGYIVENRLLQLALWQQFDNIENLTLYCPSKMVSTTSIENGYIVELENTQQLQCRLLIGADGANSQVRQQAGIGITAWDYRQHCMLINIETALPQQDITWQQFTPAGPRSFLPLPGHQGSLVWYDSPERIRRLSHMTTEQLHAEISAVFPEELGEFSVVDHGSFPLTRRHAQTYYKPNVVLLGDAAHTINPLAGQGVNLGFKDVDVLLQEIEAAGEHWAESSVLDKYQRRRRPDNLIMQTGMDFFYVTFSNNITPLKFIRNAGLRLADGAGGIKKQVLKYAMGL
ncbi:MULTISPECIES: 2-octaprenyl-3-methyl-6-methoxy-1,4-benzoquinol hydroxylase [unclassified Photobacterium]|uniref:2-octaprenyl-3-methyl-6-methoxy-1,4-benzoquinol hydroxylase n=1 Tax=unclassified Photobacterium TaxID=2628852 RepID=UPI000D170240|nr:MULTISPECIES: 2-octaprenyl-3-methyl-6-methoxy-1,4-benzoquinol hydroxylase [unclassified Photobacterium]PSV24213.1 2-octaprenyl-3-methyl-6-methoxy-1,4-benzoquinol hydroxylase [Photobacterium sp. GB-56]PSV28492.1 2-octaprenyl-3-methyl-6-methoxy-1,4-benzoquinol hydroxylase [Photobacterium sp. GB-72]PSV33661.1 2-octaprenyl-3-methyl-6-methoxy-1,4-benzoquinol hydroxylase [Photobacterium sp. GB-27]PSV40513.1 2-octaprenyl-3-methyl-6-methoxy-1,4-benzoquinol hydroxylase [Photobacterium sp. GB-210]PSV